MQVKIEISKEEYDRLSGNAKTALAGCALEKETRYFVVPGGSKKKDRTRRSPNTNLEMVPKWTGVALCDEHILAAEACDDAMDPGPVTSKELAWYVSQRLNVTKSQASGLISQLIKKGVVRAVK